MLRFLKKLFATQSTGRPPRPQARLGLESFESRDLPSASFWPGHAFHFGDQAHIGQAVAGSRQLHSTAGTGSTQVLTATLSGATGASGQVKFTSGSTTGQNSFVLSVSGLTASQTYSVQVDGTTIGQVATDTSGNGSVTLSNLAATIAAGSVVTVVDTGTTPSTTVLAGTLGHGGCHAHQELTASLTGTTGSGSATFHPEQNSLRVTVSGLTAGATYSVQLSNGTSTPTTVGQITTDSSGNGKLTVSNLAASIAAGTTISIVDSGGASVLTGTFGMGSGAPWR
jgi:hypothetical protein